MKLGDKKQATILGVVAVLCVGMLGKTALGSFSANGTAQSMTVQNLGGPGSKANSVSGIAGANSTSTSTSHVNANLDSVKESPTTIVRDAFSKPNVPEKTKSWDLERPNKSAAESQVPTPERLTDKVVSDQELPLPTGAIGNTSNQTTINHESIKPKTGPTIRFDGYIEAGSPMGVISIDGKSLSIRVGDFVEKDLLIKFLSNDRITIRKGKTSKTILIGKETKF